MGNEMGNNNTSAIKEEDNLSEAEKKSFQEDINETFIAEDVMEKASIDITNEPGKDTWQDEGHAEDVKGKTQTITTDEDKDEDTQEKTVVFDSNHTTRVLENDSMKGDTHASDVNMENQTPPVQEKAAAALVSEDATTELGKVTLQEDCHEDCMKENMQMIPTDEAKDVQEEEVKAFQEEVTGLNSNNTESRLKSDLLGEDTCKNDMNMENKIHPTAEVEDDQEKATGMTSHYSRCSLENDSLEGDAPDDDVNVNHQKHKTVEDKFDQQHIEARLEFDDETSGFDANVVEPTANVIDVQEKTSISASDSPLELTNSSEGSGDEISEVRQPEKSPSNGSIEVKGGNSESLSSFSLEGTEEYEKQEICFRERLMVTCNHHLNNEPSIQQGDEIKVKQSKMSLNDGPVEAKGENFESLSNSSVEDTEKYVKQEETCVREHMLVLDNHDLNNDPSTQQGDEISYFRPPNNDEVVETKGGNSESLLCSSFENIEEYEKQEEACLRELHLLVAYDHHLNNEPSIQQGDEVTEVSQPDASNDGSIEAEGGNSKNLSNSSLEGTEEYKKQEESWLREEISLTYNHHLNDEPPNQQADVEETTILTLSVVNMSNNIEIQESSVHSDHDEPHKFLSKQSFLSIDSLLEDNLLYTNSHYGKIKDDGLAKEMESHEKLCIDKSDCKDGNELKSSLINTFGTTSDSLSIDIITDCNSLIKVNCTTEDSLTSPLESSIVDSSLEFDHGENCKILYEKCILCRNGSTMENLHDDKPNQFIQDSLKECNMVYTHDMSPESNEECNGERNMLLGSNVTNDQIEGSKVTENKVPFDVYINTCNKASKENGVALEEKHYVVPGSKMISFIEGLAVVDCRHKEGTSYKKKNGETNEKPEVSHVIVNTFDGTEMSEQCISDLVTINQAKSSPLQNNSSLLHFYDDHQDIVKQDKSFTTTNMQHLDWKQTNRTKSSSHTIDNSGSPELTVPSLDLVDDEAYEKEGKEDPQNIEAVSSVEVELATSTTTMSIEPCLNKSIFENGSYETRESEIRLNTKLNFDNPNTSSQMKKSPSFNLNLRKEARLEESNMTPLLHLNNFGNESLSKQMSLNLINSTMLHAQYEQCVLHREEMPVEEKIVTMERSYSKKSKPPFIGLLKEEEEAHLLGMTQIQANHASTKSTVSSTSPKREDKRKPRSSFFSSCMCCATVP